MQNNGCLNFTLLILLVLILFGYVSLGQVLGVVFYIIAGFVLLLLVSMVLLRIRLRRIRRSMEEGAGQEQYRGWYRTFRSGRRVRTDEEVTVDTSGDRRPKKVGRGVGEYVDFEEVDEPAGRDENDPQR